MYAKDAMAVLTVTGVAPMLAAWALSPLPPALQVALAAAGAWGVLEAVVRRG